MQSIKIETPALSFNPTILLISKNSEYSYVINIDGRDIGIYYGTYEDYVVTSVKFEFTTDDKIYLRNVVEDLNRTLILHP